MTESKPKKKKKFRAVHKAWIVLLIIAMFLGSFTGIGLLYTDIGSTAGENNGIFAMVWSGIGNFFEEWLGIDVDLETKLGMDSPTGGVVNILALGTDEGGDRSDTIMLININGETGRVNILSIPRDTAIVSRNNDGSIIYNSSGSPVLNKINSYLAIGKQQVAKGKAKIPEELMIRKVKEITGLPIHYYVTIDFDGFIDIIDKLGGVDFDVPEDMHYEDPEQDLYIHLNKGYQHLDGQAAHDFVRFRNYKSGRADLARVEAQQAFIKELVRQKLTPSNLDKIDEIFGFVSENVTTDYRLIDLKQSLGTIEQLNADKVNMYVLPNTPRTIGGISYVVYNTEQNMEELDKILDNFRSEEQKKALGKDK